MENTNFKVEIKKTTQDYGCFHIEPLERGYGDTLGNALRRLLLSSIKGVAVIAVQIDGVLHEFSTIPGVREDVIEILMNLKHIPIKAKTEKPQLKSDGYKVITLDSDNLLRKKKDFFTREENPGVITAKDLPQDSDFEFCGDGVLCTLEPDAHLLMSIYVAPGVGYLSAERERPANLAIDALLTDAIFSPVKRVNYQIETARVGQSIDYERLILEVWTDGALLPEEAVKQASVIARNYFGHVADTIGKENVVPETKPEPVTVPDVLATILPGPEDWLPRSINDLDIPERAKNCLHRAEVETVGDMLNLSHDDLLKIRHLGKKSIAEIEETLDRIGLQLKSSSSQDDEEDSDLTDESEDLAEQINDDETDSAPDDVIDEPDEPDDTADTDIEEQKTRTVRKPPKTGRNRPNKADVKTETTEPEAEDIQPDIDTEELVPSRNLKPAEEPKAEPVKAETKRRTTKKDSEESSKTEAETETQTEDNDVSEELEAKPVKAGTKRQTTKKNSKESSKTKAETETQAEDNDVSEELEAKPVKAETKKQTTKKDSKKSSKTKAETETQTEEKAEAKKTVKSKAKKAEAAEKTKKPVKSKKTQEKSAEDSNN